MASESKDDFPAIAAGAAAASIAAGALETTAAGAAGVDVAHRVAHTSPSGSPMAMESLRTQEYVLPGSPSAAAAHVADVSSASASPMRCMHDSDGKLKPYPKSPTAEMELATALDRVRECLLHPAKDHPSRRVGLVEERLEENERVRAAERYRTIHRRAQSALAIRTGSISEMGTLEGTGSSSDPHRLCVDLRSDDGWSCSNDCESWYTSAQGLVPMRLLPDLNRCSMLQLNSTHTSLLMKLGGTKPRKLALIACYSIELDAPDEKGLFQLPRAPAFVVQWDAIVRDSGHPRPSDVVKEARAAHASIRLKPSPSEATARPGMEKGGATWEFAGDDDVIQFHEEVFDTNPHFDDSVDHSMDEPSMPSWKQCSEETLDKFVPMSTALRRALHDTTNENLVRKLQDPKCNDDNVKILSVFCEGFARASYAGDLHAVQTIDALVQLALCTADYDYFVSILVRDALGTAVVTLLDRLLDDDDEWAGLRDTLLSGKCTQNFAGPSSWCSCVALIVRAAQDNDGGQDADETVNPASCAGPPAIRAAEGNDDGQDAVASAAEYATSGAGSPALAAHEANPGRDLYRILTAARDDEDELVNMRMWGTMAQSLRLKVPGLSARIAELERKHDLDDCALLTELLRPATEAMASAPLAAVLGVTIAAFSSTWLARRHPLIAHGLHARQANATDKMAPSEYKAVKDDAAKRPHKPNCTAVPSQCTCPGQEELWAFQNVESVDTRSIGKWLVFPRIYANSKAMDTLWSTIKEATAQGYLGFATKLSRRKPHDPALMIYVADGTDKRIRRAIGKRLQQVLFAAGYPERELVFKSDAVTDAGIVSPQGLPPRDLRPNKSVPAAVDKVTSDKLDGLCKHFFAPNECEHGRDCNYEHITASKQADLSSPGSASVPVEHV